MTKSKKKQRKQGDFEKVKLKVGKKLKKANATSIDLKSKALIIPGQESLIRSVIPDDLKSKEQVKNHISHLKHPNANVRKRSLAGILSEIDSDLALINICLESLDSVLQRMVDEEAHIRRQLLKLLEVIFSNVDTFKLEPFLPKIFTYAVSTMTHLLADIRIDSLKYLNLCFNHFGIKFIPPSTDLLTENFLALFPSGTSHGHHFSNTNQFASSSFKHLLLTTFGKYLQLLHSKENGQPISLPLPSPGSVLQSRHVMSLPEPSLLLSEYHVSINQAQTTPSTNSNHGSISLLSRLSPLVLHLWIETSQTVFSKTRIHPDQELEICQACTQLLYYVWGMQSATPDATYLKNYKNSILRHFLLYFPFGQGLQADEKAGLILLAMNLYMVELLHKHYAEDKSLFLPYFERLFHKKSNLTLSEVQLEMLSSTIETCFVEVDGFLELFLKWMQSLPPNRPIRSASLLFFIDFLKKSGSKSVVSAGMIQRFTLDLMDSLCRLDHEFTSLVCDGLFFLKFVFCSSYQFDNTFLSIFAAKLTSFFCDEKNPNDFGPFIKLTLELQRLVIDFLYFFDLQSFPSILNGLSYCLEAPSVSKCILARTLSVLEQKPNLHPDFVQNLKSKEKLAV